MKKIYKFFVTLNLNPKIEILKNIAVLSTILIVSLFIGLYYKSTITIVIGLTLLLIYPLGICFYYLSLKDKKDNELFSSFINSFNYLKMYLETGSNVYNGLNEIRKYSNKELNYLINILISEIDNDKSLEPFIKFSKNFNNLLVDQLMVQLYQLVDSTNYNDDFKYFSLTFDRLLEENEKILHKKRKDVLSGKTVFALIGSAVFILAIMVGVISVMGEMINGI